MLHVGFGLTIVLTGMLITEVFLEKLINQMKNHSYIQFRLIGEGRPKHKTPQLTQTQLGITQIEKTLFIGNFIEMTAKKE